MIVAIHGRSTVLENAGSIVSILDFLESKGVEIYMYDGFLRFINDKLKLKRSYPVYSSGNENPKDTSFMVSLGGDGTFLDAARYAREANIPLVGINLGRLGFLAYISNEDANESLSQILSGDYEVEERSTLMVSGSFLPSSQPLYALNEATIQRKKPSLIELSVAIDGEHLASYWSDGLIVATPTGSTAYSMSVGGPIVAPTAANLILSPLAPHNLAIRPIIIPDSSVVTCLIRTRSERVMVTVDNQMLVVEDKTELTIQKSPFSVKLIKLKDSNFYRTLKNKLHWGIDPRN